MVKIKDNPPSLKLRWTKKGTRKKVKVKRGAECRVLGGKEKWCRESQATGDRKKECEIEERSDEIP